MFLPCKENAIVKLSKINDYLLSENHPVGRSKAKFFKMIGFNETNIDLFGKALLEISKLEVIETVKNDFGTKYVIIGMLKSPLNIEYLVSTVWMLENQSNEPYLVTCYPK